MVMDPNDKRLGPDGMALKSNIPKSRLDPARFAPEAAHVAAKCRVVEQAPWSPSVILGDDGMRADGGGINLTRHANDFSR